MNKKVLSILHLIVNWEDIRFFTTSFFFIRNVLATSFKKSTKHYTLSCHFLPMYFSMIGWCITYHKLLIDQDKTIPSLNLNDLLVFCA